MTINGIRTVADSAVEDAIETWRPISEEQTAFLASTADEVLFGGAAGPGKALALDTPIPTLSGFVPMRDISEGDTVFGSDGLPYLVIGVSSVMVRHQVYDVEFDDGSSIRADGDHIWHTFTNTEREKKRKRKPEVRKHRRSIRRKRGTGAKPWLSRRNTERALAYTPDIITGGLRTTVEIAETLTVRGRRNHAIRVTKPVAWPEAELLIDPYVFGCWLGDGNSHYGGITIDENEPELIRHIEVAGYEIRNWSERNAFGIAGITGHLRRLNVIANKHIPDSYLYSSIEQRKALLCGLMDTDGTAGKDGCCEFYSSSERLITQVSLLLYSLGIKHSIREKKPPRNTDYGVSYRIGFTASFPVFRLSRKRKRQNTNLRETANWRYVVSVTEVPSEPVKCIAVNSPDNLYLAGTACIPTHNTECLVIEALRQIGNPKYNGVIFRRTYTQLNDADGVIPRMHRWYPGYGGVFNTARSVWSFPSGAKIFARHMQHASDMYNYQGAQYQYIGWDELTQFEETMYLYLMTRNRAEVGSGLRCYVRSASNPGGIGHRWVKRRFITSGITNSIGYFARVNGEDTAVEKTHPEAMSRLFIPALFGSNPKLSKEYIRNLKTNDPVTAAQLIEGDWDAENREFLIYPDFGSDNIRRIADFADGVPVFWTADDGYTNPRAILLLQVRAIDGIERICVFDEHYASGLLAATAINDVLDYGYGDPDFVYHDPASPEFGANVERAGLAAWGAVNDVAEGIKAVRRFIRDANGVRRLYVHPRCVNLIDELYEYRKDERKQATKGGDSPPMKIRDHACDALRYFVATYYG